VAAPTYLTGTRSHTSSGSFSQAQFSWQHSTASPRGVLVFTFVNANADNALSVLYNGVSMSTVASGYRAVDTATEAGDCKAWFLGSGIPVTNPATVTVNRTNNANVMWGCCITVGGIYDTVVDGATVLLQENQVPAQQNVTTTRDAVRFAGLNYGGTTPTAGANSTGVQSLGNINARSLGVVRETTAGSGARPVGFATSTDDVAAVHLAITESPITTPIFPRVRT